MSISQQAAAPLRQPRGRLPHAGGSTPAALSRPGASKPAAVRLRVVAPADVREGNGAMFIAACVLVLALGLGALLILNTQRAQQSFTIDSLQGRSTTLTDSQQSLSSKLQLAESPSSLAARAYALGMAPASKIRYVGPDGKTVGVANGAAGSNPFTVGPLTAGGAADVAGAASVGASLGAGVGAPAPSKPTVKKPSATKPTAKKPSASKAAATKPTAKKPATGPTKAGGTAGTTPKTATKQGAAQSKTGTDSKSKAGNTSTTQR